MPICPPLKECFSSNQSPKSFKAITETPFLASQVQYRTSQIIYAEFFEQVNNKIITIYTRAQHEGQDLMIHR